MSELTQTSMNLDFIIFNINIVHNTTINERG